MTDSSPVPLPAPKLKKLNISFNEKEHVYRLNDNFVPGCTTVLKARSQPWLMPWALKEAINHVSVKWDAGKAYTEDEISEILTNAKSAHRRKSDKAKDVGSEVHEFIKQYVAARIAGVKWTGVSYPSREVVASCEAFRVWESKHNVEWLMSEFIVASELHRYAGTVDFLARVDGQLVIGDFKTSARISEDYHLQLAAYLCAFIEMLESPLSPLPARAILRIPKDGGPHEFRILESDLRFDIDAFLALRRIHQWNNYIQSHQEEINAPAPAKTNH